MDLRSVDPATLRVPPSRRQGADPARLWRQVARFGHETEGMPPILVIEGKDGELAIMNGVTRATRIAKFSPGTAVTVEVQSTNPRLDLSKLPTIRDLLP